MKVMIWSSVATPAVHLGADLGADVDAEALLRDSNTLSPSQIGQANRLLIASIAFLGVLELVAALTEADRQQRDDHHAEQRSSRATA